MGEPPLGPVGDVHKDTPMFSLAIDFFDEFGLQRLTELEKLLNELSIDCKKQLDKEQAQPHPSAPGL